LYCSEYFRCWLKIYWLSLKKGETKKMYKFDYNLIVIGVGSGGLVSTFIASAVKAKVALIENHKMGGDCLNTGCVPWYLHRS
jgi:ribulose 1,5-bisphosphate synthetase/thiazole synthase